MTRMGFEDLCNKVWSTTARRRRGSIRMPAPLPSLSVILSGSGCPGPTIFPNFFGEDCMVPKLKGSRSVSKLVMEKTQEQSVSVGCACWLRFCISPSGISNLDDETKQVVGPVVLAGSWLVVGPPKNKRESPPSPVAVRVQTYAK